MVQPPTIDPLGLAREALELEAQATDDTERRMVGCRSRHTHPMHSKTREREIEARARRFRHQAVADGFGPQPVAELARTVHLDAPFETNDTDHAPAEPLAYQEAERPSVIPLAGARLSKACRRRGVRLKRHPRQPRLEPRARGIDDLPHFTCVSQLDRYQDEPLR